MPWVGKVVRIGWATWFGLCKCQKKKNSKNQKIKKKNEKKKRRQEKETRIKERKGQGEKTKERQKREKETPQFYNDKKIVKSLF